MLVKVSPRVVAVVSRYNTTRVSEVITLAKGSKHLLLDVKFFYLNN